MRTNTARRLEKPDKPLRAAPEGDRLALGFGLMLGAGALPDGGILPFPAALPRADGSRSIAGIAAEPGIAPAQLACRAQRLLFSGSPAAPWGSCAQKDGGSA